MTFNFSAFRYGQLALLFMTSFMLFGSGLASAEEPVVLDRVLAIVDDDIVMESELESRLTQIANRLKQQGTPLPPQRIMEQRVLEQLIIENIQLQKAERAGIRISDTQLNETQIGRAHV